MKHILLLLLLSYATLCYSEVEKPITKGNVALGGSGSIQFLDGFRLRLSPSMGYFFTDGLLMGLQPSFYFSHAQVIYYWELGVSPFAKYYFQNGLFVGIGLDFAVRRASDKENLLNKSYSLSVDPRVGYAIFINSKVSLEPALVYNSSMSKYIDGDGQEIGKGSDLYVTIGFRVFL